MADTYARDVNSFALINTDFRGVQAYKERRRKSERLQKLELDINILRNDMAEIKYLLQNIIPRD